MMLTISIMKKYLLIIPLGTIGLIALLTTAAFFLYHRKPDWARQLIYVVPVNGKQVFDGMASRVNRIVIYDDGFNCCGDDPPKNFVKEYNDKPEIDRVLSYFTVPESDPKDNGGCMCCGRPRVEFYDGTNLIALTALQHGKGIRWSGFSGSRYFGVTVGYADAALTSASQKEIARWLEEDLKIGYK
jgi:hypothetical protein